MSMTISRNYIFTLSIDLVNLYIYIYALFLEVWRCCIYTAKSEIQQIKRHM